MNEGTLSESGQRLLPHVQLVTWDDEPAVGGQGVYVRELRNALEVIGVRTSTMAGRGRNAVPYRHLTGHGPLDLSLALNRSPRRLVAGRPDLLHVSGGPGGLQIVRRLGVPMVVTAHHTFELAHRRYQPQRWYGLIETWGYKLAQAVVAVSVSTADSLCRIGIRADRIVVVPPGVRENHFCLGGERGHRRMLFVGRLEPEKGPMDALDAMREVLDNVPDASGVIVGSGSLGQRVAGRVRDVARVEYRSLVSEEELVHLYAQADVVLMPSAFEGVGLVALEAMAAGCVVIGYDVAGLQETVGPYGVLVKAGDVSALAHACAKLLNDTHRQAELGAAASDMVRRGYSWDRCARHILDVYRSIVY